MDQDVNFAVPSVTVSIEKVLQWSQRKEPNPQTPIYQNLGSWGEAAELRVEKPIVGIYLGDGFVAMVNVEDAQTRCVYCGLLFAPDRNHPEHLCWQHLASANQAVETWKMECENLRQQLLDAARLKEDSK